MSVADEVLLSEPSPPKKSGQAVLYLVHDVHDAAVRKRVDMLQRGGANVTVAGYRRRGARISALLGAPVIDLGRTHDAKLVSRAASVAKTILLELSRIERLWESPIAVIARNLEMVAIGWFLRARAENKIRLIYECLDVHRALIGRGTRAIALRAIERQCLQSCDLLVVSSGAFVSQYFEPIQHFCGDWLLAENKVLSTERNPACPPRLAGPPWRIGWFGVLRCQRSLDMLCALVAKHPNAFQVVLRGLPALQEFREFHGQIAGSDNVEFAGSYEPAQIADIYRGIHYAWAVDYFDAGANSDWLLPNRLYEAGAHGVPVIGRIGSELSRVIESWKCGISIDPVNDPAWEAGLDVSADEYYLLRERVEDGRAKFVSGDADCENFVQKLCGNSC